MTTNFLPLLYQNPQQLTPEQHDGLKLDLETGFAFASKTNSVPLVIEEFGATCRDYVIVFRPVKWLCPWWCWVCNPTTTRM